MDVAEFEECGRMCDRSGVIPCSCFDGLGVLRAPSALKCCKGGEGLKAVGFFTPRSGRYDRRTVVVVKV